MGYTFFLFSLVFSPRVDTLLMKTVKSFGDNPSDEYIIGIISDIKYDKGLLYIADMKENRIMVYDTLGNFVKQIGSPGQGPGELLNPEKIAIENDSIFVLNSGNSRIEIFDINGKPLGSFPFPRDRCSIIGEMYVYHNRVYLPVPGQEGLITVYTPSGNQIVRLGKEIPPPPNKDIKIWDSGIIIVYKDLIYYFYYAFPWCYVFNSEGKLEKRIKIYSPQIKDVLINQKELIKEDGKDKRSTIYFLLHDAYIRNEKIYCLSFGHLHILSLDGKLERVVHLKGERIGDQFAVDESGKVWVVTPVSILCGKP